MTKTVSWRLIATCITLLIALLLTGDIRVATGIGFLDMVIKTAGFYLHERVWANHVDASQAVCESCTKSSA